MLMPYVHVDTYHVSLAEPVIRNCDLFLAITGKTWFDAVPDSVTAHWRPKMVHVDLAVDRADFPRVKTAFAAPGSRRFLYIGHTGWYKNTGYLSELARRLPEAEIAWMGGGGAIPGVRPLGRQDFATPAARELVAQHDFLLTVGSGDANPSSILEAMAWGLVPVCTPESGYPAQAGIVNVPLDDPGAAVDTLRRLQAAPDEELRALRAANDDLLAGHFTWDRFAAQVVDAIESDASPELLPLEPAQARRLRTLALRRQASWLLPPNLRFAARSALRATRPGRAVLAARARRRS